MADRMRIWTIQPLEVWESLSAQHLLYVQPEKLKYGGYLPRSYKWLRQQLRKRMTGYLGHFPWWGYCRKPDLRQHRHVLRKGDRAVRLELEVDGEAVVTFPCWAWHRVFCEDYLAFSQEQYDRWITGFRGAVRDEDLWPPPDPWRSELEISWERLFAVELPPLDWDKSSFWVQREYFEGVFETLRVDDVRRIDRFTGTLEAGLV